MHRDEGFHEGRDFRIGVISDTHIPSRARRLPDFIGTLFAGVDAILHAGDIVDVTVLDVLRSIAPTYAVMGNCDLFGTDLPSTLEVRFGDTKVGMIHDSGSSSGRAERMRKTFPGCRVVVFGHSHKPLIEDDGSVLLLNPGSACDPRWVKVPTVATLELSGGRVEAQLHEVRA